MAAAFLGFLKDAFGPERLPTVRGATLAACWTVKHAIKMKVRNVGYDVDVFVLEPKGKDFVATMTKIKVFRKKAALLDELRQEIKECIDELEESRDEKT